MLDKLFEIIEERKEQQPSNSYTWSLIRAGEEKILRKINEESFEVIMASSNEGDQRLIEESADLMYHLFVLLASKGLTLAQVEDELQKRHMGRK
jgi:phosphoribosyl-ATP pyrophosphohydrolase